MYINFTLFSCSHGYIIYAYVYVYVFLVSIDNASLCNMNGVNSRYLRRTALISPLHRTGNSFDSRVRIGGTTT